MKLRKIIISVLFFVLCVAAGAADRKYIVKPRSADRKALSFSEGARGQYVIHSGPYRPGRQDQHAPG